MTPIKDGGPAFPVEIGRTVGPMCEGMSLRDYFAAKIAGGDAAAGETDGQAGGWGNAVPDSMIAIRATLYYRIADAMLAEREKGQP